LSLELLRIIAVLTLAALLTLNEALELAQGVRLLLAFVLPLLSLLVEQLFVDVQIGVLDGLPPLGIELLKQHLNLRVGEVSHLHVPCMIPLVLLQKFLDALLHECNVRGRFWLI